MKATGWRGGPPNTTGAGYGISISRNDRNKYFDPDWNTVTLDVGDERIVVELSVSFWKNCTELRSKKIGEFMLANGLAPWRKRQPPVFELVPEGDGVFRLAIPE